MTNFEKIKAMSVEEMAELLDKTTYAGENCKNCPAISVCFITTDGCKAVFKKYLESEVQEE